MANLNTILKTSKKFSLFSQATVLSEEEEVRLGLQNIEQALQRTAFNASDFLPIEQKAAKILVEEKRSALAVKRSELRAKLNAIVNGTEINTLRRQMHILVAESGFDQQLDPVVVAAATKLGPTFMVSPFDNTSGEVKITIHLNSEKRMFLAKFEPSFPPNLTNIMQDSCKLAASNYGGDYTKVVITAAFSGFAAEERERVLNSVKKAQGAGVFSQILVIAEAPKWEVNEVVTQVKPDPLVVGWVEKTSQMFLIDRYNLTPLERYIADQFAFGVSLNKK